MSEPLTLAEKLAAVDALAAAEKIVGGRAPVRAAIAAPTLHVVAMAWRLVLAERAAETAARLTAAVDALFTAPRDGAAKDAVLALADELNERVRALGYEPNSTGEQKVISNGADQG